MKVTEIIKEYLPIDMKNLLLQCAIFSSGFLSGAILVKYSHRILNKGYYEDNDILSQYILLHYGKENEQLQWEDGPISAVSYPKKCIDILIEHCKPINTANALDVGCAVGRSSYELSKYFETVDAFDLSHQFIDFCNRIKLDKIMDYSVIKEGDIVDNFKAHLPDDCNPERVHFFIGNACKNINVQCSSESRKYDCVVALNLIDRLTEPMKFISQLSHLVSDGGIVMISSPYTWLKQFTKKNNWLGGKMSADGNELITTRDTIVDSMNSNNFNVILEKDIPMLIRETARRYQWTMAHAIIFKKQPLTA